MAKSEPLLSSTFLLLLTIILFLSQTCQADKSDATTVSKDVTQPQPSPVCVCGPGCGYPCLYTSPPPPGALPPPSAMSPPGMPSPDLYSPPPPFWPWPTPMTPYPWYKPPPPHGQVYAADGGFEFYKPSVARRRGVSCTLVLVCGGILVLLL